jgi:hypothetical protein
MKKYKISEANLSSFWDFLLKKKKGPAELQKIVDNDPILKKLQADVDRLDASTGPLLHKVKQRNPEIYANLVKMGLVPKDI